MSLNHNHVVVSSAYDLARAQYIQVARIDYQQQFGFDERTLLSQEKRHAILERAKFNAKIKIDQAVREWEQEISEQLYQPFGVASQHSRL